jgi:RNA polymerase sigma-70 factor (TIGR02943 family)
MPATRSPASTLDSRGQGGSASPGGEIAALQPMLMRVARLQLRNAAWAEDAVSATLVAALEGLPAFDRRSALATWVVGILKHKIVDQLRRGTREVSIDIDEELGGGDALESLFAQDGHRVQRPGDWGDPEASLSRSEFLAVLQACLDQLPGALARAFLLREWLEFDTAEICKELKVSSTNCFVMLYRARMRLRECLAARWFEGDAAQNHG